MSSETKPPIEDQIEQLKKEIGAVATTVSEAASGRFENVQHQAEEAVGDLEKRVRRDPVKSVAIAAGVGFVLGALISR